MREITNILSEISAILVCLVGYKNQLYIKRFFEKHLWIHKIFPYFVCFVISFLFANNLALSPFNNIRIGTDSSVFVYIGKAMYNGAIPYKNLFDHKGIGLYLLEYFGVIIGFGSEVGIWIIEFIHIFITSIIFYKLAKLIVDDDYVCFLAIYISLNISGMAFFKYEFGNLTEEYALLWISLTLYFVTKYFITKEYKKWNIILIGISFSMVLCLRPNMDGPIGVMVLLVLISFITNKRYLEIAQCTFLFIAGCLITLAPMLGYLLYTESLQDMIKYYIDFNLIYSTSGSIMQVVNFLFLCAFYSLSNVIFTAYVLVKNRKNKIVLMNLAVLVAAFVFSAVGGRGYLHYAIIFIPFFIIPAAMAISDFIKKLDNVKIKSKSVTKMATVLLCMGMFLPSAYYLYAMYKIPVEDSPVIKYIKEKTTNDDDVLVLGNEVADYLLTDRTTKNKFFFQTPVNISDELFEELIEEMNSKPSDYILYPLGEDSGIKKRTEKKLMEYFNQKCEQKAYSVEKYEQFYVYIKNESDK